MLRRPRRNRKNAQLRNLVSETRLHPSNLIAPFFLIDGFHRREPIQSMPGIERLTIDQLLIEAELLHLAGIQAIALFPNIDRSLKDEKGSYALNANGLIPKAIRQLKAALPSLAVIADVALDPYTSHGHDGLIDSNGYVLNDPTIVVLAQQSKVLAEAGADILAPSDMMDGRIGFIRTHLDAAGFTDVNLCAYTAKYASTFYGPFRDACGSTLVHGNKKTYQMDPANRREALIEAALDSNEGADMLLVKPALCYLDVIAALRAASSLPICAYQVSGEYAMIMAAGQAGYLDAQAALFEATLAIKRAGADLIFTYGTKQLLNLDSENIEMLSAVM